MTKSNALSDGACVNCGYPWGARDTVWLDEVGALFCSPYCAAEYRADPFMPRTDEPLPSELAYLKGRVNP